MNAIYKLHVSTVPHCHWKFLIYSYFEKGCQKKCTWQSQKVLWVVLIWVHCYSKKLGRVAWETMDGTYVCLWVIKQRNKSRFHSYSVKKQCIDHTVSHINFRDCCVHIFFQQPFSKQLYPERHERWLFIRGSEDLTGKKFSVLDTKVASYGRLSLVRGGHKINKGLTVYTHLPCQFERW